MKRVSVAVLRATVPVRAYSAGRRSIDRGWFRHYRVTHLTVTLRTWGEGFQVYPKGTEQYAFALSSVNGVSSSTQVHKRSIALAPTSRLLSLCSTEPEVFQFEFGATVRSRSHRKIATICLKAL